MRNGQPDRRNCDGRFGIVPCKLWRKYDVFALLAGLDVNGRRAGAFLRGLRQGLATEFGMMQVVRVRFSDYRFRGQGYLLCGRQEGEVANKNLR